MVGPLYEILSEPNKTLSNMHGYNEPMDPCSELLLNLFLIPGCCESVIKRVGGGEGG